jgi:hypothetical protein
VALSLKTLCFVSGYRFHNFLHPKLRLPYSQPTLNAKEVRDKARASSAVAGLFLAFLLALLAALATIEKKDVLDNIQPVNCELGIIAVVGALLPYLSLREQRKISAANWEAKSWQERAARTARERQQREKTLRVLHRALLALWFLLYIALFIAHRCEASFSRALALSGLLLVLGSLLFLISSVELYDTAGGLQKLENTEYHFHMASLASHCYLLGFSMGLVGFCLLLCIPHPRAGYYLSLVALVFLVAMTEAERELYNLGA